ncbi:alpha/beta fold hydrolase [Paenibacillus senegalimassiliensis]|uniref:alpha/beta fold hydrolase n=1 Tax=Paenibacillus senegalimassiliensis TaxID=1737426 RepID=UPI00073EB71D|nr:alpha/beta hydrolase [Paenibacillus senegalimassiliensis]
MKKQKSSRPRLKKTLWIIGGMITALVVTAVVLLIRFDHYVDPWHKKVAEAGIQEKTAKVNSVQFNYAEGPDNGPALLLLNAQHMDWFSYSRVLPELSESFHVFAVDYPGHGKTTYPADYTMSANQIGGDLADFIETVIQEPAFVTGNSSGGLLTTWLAANKPELVKAVVLEDPPLFSAEYPRVQKTIANKSFALSHRFLEEGEDDLLMYWLESASDFFEKHAGKNALPVIKAAIATYRNANPGEAVEISFLPDTLRLMIRGFNYYDPHFGAAFYEGTWNEQFDHAEALQKIECPTLLIHANFEILEDGTLSGAMSQEDADQAISLIPNAQYLKVDAEHVVHLDKPEQFIQIVKDFFLN